MTRSCVLHVDDDSNDRFLLEHASKRANLGLRVLSLDSGEQAIAYLSGQGHYGDRSDFPLPCVILLDIKMRGLTGFDVLKWVREQTHFREIVIIMFSGSKHDDDVQQAASLGANSFVNKPTDCKLLTQFLRALEEYWLTFHEFGWDSNCRPKNLVTSASA